MADGYDQQYGDKYLCAAQTKHGTMHGLEARQAEFQTDAEHQEYHAEFGKMACAGRIRYPAKGMRPDQNPDREITQHHRQTQNATYHYHQYGGSQEYEYG